MILTYVVDLRDTDNTLEVAADQLVPCAYPRVVCQGNYNDNLGEENKGRVNKER